MTTRLTMPSDRALYEQAGEQKKVSALAFAATEGGRVTGTPQTPQGSVEEVDIKEARSE